MTTYHDLFKPAADDFQVGQQVTVLGWTDRHSYTIIARTAKVLTLQADDVAWDGRSGTARSVTRDENGYIRVARLTTKRGITGWRSDGQTVVAGSHPYRDPSF